MFRFVLQHFIKQSLQEQRDLDFFAASKMQKMLRNDFFSLGTKEMVSKGKFITITVYAKRNGNVTSTELQLIKDGMDAEEGFAVTVTQTTPNRLQVKTELQY